MNNPFVYGKEVSGYQFYDRTNEAEELYRYMKDGSTNIVLYAPRRYGKTSLVHKVLTRLKAEGCDCLLFNISKVASLEKFCESFASAVYTIYGGLPEIGNRLARYLSHLHPTIGVSLTGLTIRFDYGERMGEMELSEVLDLPEKLAKDAGGRPLVIAFDEFQEVASFSSRIPVEAVFRSVIQTHRVARYVFFGSKTHLMKRMFGGPTRPFYRAAFNMKIGKPPRAESEEFLVSRFETEGISIRSEEINRIIEVSENIPYYLQAIAGLAFRRIEHRRGAELQNDDVDYAIAAFVESNEDLYDETLKGLSPSQRNLLEAMAREIPEQFDESYRLRYGLGGISTVHSALRGLLERGHVESVKRTYAIGDPFFARYIREMSASRCY